MKKVLVVLAILVIAYTVGGQSKAQTCEAEEFDFLLECVVLTWEKDQLLQGKTIVTTSYDETTGHITGYTFCP